MSLDEAEKVQEGPAEESAEVLRGQVEHLYRNAPLGMAATVVNAALVTWVEWNVASTRGLVAWLAALAAVTALRAADLFQFRRAGGAAVQAEIGARRFAAGMFLSGAAWGAVGLLAYPVASLNHLIFLAFVLGGMVAGAAGALAATRLAFTAFAVPALLPIALRLALVGEELGVAMGGMIVLFGILVTAAAAHTHRTVLTSLRMRFENDRLIRFLSAAKEKAEAANRQLAAEVTVRKRAERELAEHRDQLQELVAERTAELEAALEELRLDVERREQAAEELREAKLAAEAGSRAKSEFLANMSHELRTPMNGVLGLIELVLGQDLTRLQEEYLRGAQRSARSLLRILNEILDLSRIESGRLELEEEEFDLRGAVEGAAEVSALEAQAKGLELVVHVRRETPTRVVGDPGRLRQVLVNLVGNAVKFTDEGEVVISVSAEASPPDDTGDGAARRLRFSVRDTGIGVPRDRQHLLFESFRQVDGSSTRRHGGAGLGLAISKRIVEKLGGALEVQSEPGKGSTFSFSLPFRVFPADSGPRRSGDGPRVLVVDDSASSRAAIVDALDELGAVAVAVDTVQEAERRIGNDEERFRLVLFDARLGGTDGFAAVSQLGCRSDPLSPPVAVMVPVHDPGRDLARCLELGVAGCLSKPVRLADLADLLRGTVGVDETTRPSAAARSPRSSTAEPEADPRHEPAPGRILLVEDDPASQLFFSTVLESEGWEVTRAGSGQEGIEASEGGRFDVILMDVQLPGLDGFAATREIRAREASGGSRVPIVGITAHALPRDRERCLEAGMDDHLPKPLEAGRLVATVRHHLGQSARRDGAPADPTGVLGALRGRWDPWVSLVATFGRTYPEALRRVEEALDCGDGAGAADAAHGLRGSSGLFGARAVMELTERVEASAKEGRLEEARAIVPTLRDRLHELAAYLQAYRPPAG